jgi:copper homeostasis protein (lipoprotein)
MAMALLMPFAVAQQTNQLGTLPASFVGKLPCADCPGIRYALNLYPDNSFFLRMVYLERADAKPFDDIGRWALSSDGSTLILKGGKESSERFAVKSSDILRKLDMQGREIDSKLNYDLRRTSAFERIDPRLLMRGMFRYMADAATFTECQTGQRWPVAMEGAYKSLEAAYSKTRRQPADELLVNLEGHVAMRPNPDSGQPTPTLLVERYIGIWPGETCGPPLATALLQETYWKLTRLEDNPVMLAEKQREPSLVFRSQQNRVTGFGGCNNLTGTYVLNGGEITFKGVAATQRACLQGMDIEGALFKVLEKVRRWKIFGQHLELYDAGGKMLARFEARQLK